MLITFESGSNIYSNKTPFDFNFTTSYQQKIDSKIENGSFGFVNVVPNYYSTWHNAALDHTLNDGDNGYMYLVNMNENGGQLFSSIVNDLYEEELYEFSAFLANVDRNQTQNNYINPNIRFEVRSAIDQNDLLGQSNTGSISQSSNMTWSKYGVTFVASSSSVILLMISSGGVGLGNDIAIDDIELRACSTEHFESYPPG